MRKLILTFVALFLVTASAFAAEAVKPAIATEEINIRGGAETGFFAFRDKSKEVDRRNTKDSDFGLSFSGEYLYPIISSLKAGFGFQYVLPRSADNIDGAQRFSWLPIYGTVQFYPSRSHKNAYIKGSAGYTISYIADTSFKLGVKQKDYTGFYLGSAIGVEFKNVFVEFAYDYYNTRSEIYIENKKYETLIGGYTKYGINIGWKFKVRILDSLISSNPSTESAQAKKTNKK